MLTSHAPSSLEKRRRIGTTRSRLFRVRPRSLLPIRRRCLIGQRLQALWLVAGFVTLLGVSGPHLVHHLFESHDSHEHSSQGHQPQPSTDCLVLFLMQHTPLVGSAASGDVCLFLAGPQVVLGLPCELPGGVTGSLQARAPPAPQLLTMPVHA